MITNGWLVAPEQPTGVAIATRESHMTRTNIRLSRFLRPSPAMVVAAIALLASTAGVSYAALEVTGANVRDASLTGRDVRNGTMASKDVKDRSLLARDFKRGQLRPGPTGPQGPAGQHGPAGANGAQGPQGSKSYLSYNGTFSGSGPIKLRCNAGNGHPLAASNGSLVAIKVGGLG